MLTLFDDSNSFAVWNVPDGQLMAFNHGAPIGITYLCTDFGVPGSASDGLVGLGAVQIGAVYLWDASPPPEGCRNLGPPEGPSRPRLRSRVDLEPFPAWYTASFSFSSDGSKFATAVNGVAFVYDVASLTRLGAYTSPGPSLYPKAVWASDGRHVLVSWGDKSACFWDSSRPNDLPSVVTIRASPGSHFHSWSPSGASYFVFSLLKGQAPNGPTTRALEERRAADGSLVRAVNLGPTGGFSRVSISPDAHALLVGPGVGVSPRASLCSAGSPLLPRPRQRLPFLA